MNCYPMAVVERMMKIQAVILQAMVKKTLWLVGVSQRIVTIPIFL
jgi:hypothetical protein